MMKGIKIMAAFCLLVLLAIPASAHAALSDNLSAYWNLNETAGSSRQDSVGSATFTEQGGSVLSATGKIGNAVSISSANNLFLSTPDSTALSTGNIDFTVAGWVQLRSKSATSVLFAKQDTVNNQREWQVSYAQTQDRFSFFVNSDGTAGGSVTVRADALGSPSTNTWYYIVAWHDAANDTINIQVNNGAVNSLSHTLGVRDGTSPVTIGASASGASVATSYMDEVAFWKRVLTTQERTSLYNSGFGTSYPLDLTAPGAPTGLTAGSDDGKALLSWTAPTSTGNSAVNDYVIEYKLASDSSWTTFSDGTSAAVAATVTGLTNGSSYNFRVSAVNAVGTGSASSIATATPAPILGTVSITDPNLYWSPYNWYFNGSQYAQTTPGGGYVKVAFTGSTLGIGVDTSNNIDVDLSTIKVAAYIDGSTVPVEKTLADVSGGVVNFSSALSAGQHTAVIYLTKTFVSNDAFTDRWNSPVVNALRVTKIQLASDGATTSLTDTAAAPKSTKILVYGDSITEGGSGNPMSNNAYSAVMARALGVEYGQVGYGGLGWTKKAVGGTGTAYFYEAVPANSLWRKYDSAHSRLVNNADSASGFISGAPDAVFVNLGINDANNDTGAPALRTKTTSWITEVRAASGANAAIFVISPFNYGNTGNPTYVTYKAALFGGVTDYQAANSGDTRVYTLDLGTSGYNTVTANSSDNLHPNDAGAAILGAQLAALADDYIVAPVISAVSSTAITTTSATITWTTDELSSSQVSYGTTGSYGTTTAETNTSPRVTSHSVELTGLAPGTTYHYQVASKDAGNTVATSADYTFTTTAAHSTGGGGGGGGSYTASVTTTTAAATPSTDTSACLPGNAFSSVTGARCPVAVSSATPGQGTIPVLTSNLRLKISGEEVRALQRYLNSKGFTVAITGAGSPGNETAYFGPATKAAVITYQKHHSLKADGIVGPATRAMVNKGL